MNAKPVQPKPTAYSDEKIACSIPDTVEVMDRLFIMQKQENTTYACSDYLASTSSSSMIDELCREKMLGWCFQVTEFANLKPDNVVVAMSYLDLFLSSGTASAMDAIRNRKVFQLASMTTLYMAFKLFEPVEINLLGFVMLGKNAYAAEDFVKMEFDILSALNWRINGPTVLSFLEHLFAVVPPGLVRGEGMEILTDICKQYTEVTLSDYYFVTQKPSDVAIAIICTSLQHIPLDLIDEKGRRSLVLKISNALKIQCKKEVLLATRRLASKSDKLVNVESKPAHIISCEAGKIFRVSSPNSSPICVSVRDKKI